MNDTTCWTSAETRSPACRLKAGSRVVVYLERDGFTAIRPPADATSGIDAQVVQREPDGWGTLLRPADALACNNAGLRAERTLRLAAGERVRLISRVKQASGKVWWRIEPPEGDYRWVRTTDLRFAETPVREASITETGRSGASVATVAHEAEADEPPPLFQLPALPHATAATSPPSSSPSRYPSTARSVTAAPDASAEVSSLAPSATPLTPSRALPRAPLAEVTPSKADEAPFAARLSAAEFALSTVVANATSSWRLGPLRAEADLLSLAAADERERALARDLATRIDRFADIANRSAVAGTTRLAPPVRRTKTSPSNPASDDSENEAARLGYDAIGKLRPVVSSTPGAPTHALVGAEGQIVTLVTASRGVDLAPLLGKRVGVSGSRGFMPQYGKDHLTAQRVTPVGELRR
ncbi:hypothetical protein [Botrimarina hoheduenensis]|uniref:hypothetical protein n=1 Tax=Botrimarina hoheduenensis TaxID=2528000 RepID=UPI0011B39C70|nr:hypothetical protein [Botrimarina hoheduenensis]